MVLHLKSLPVLHPAHLGFLLCSRSFMVLRFTFRFLFHFELAFVKVRHVLLLAFILIGVFIASWIYGSVFGINLGESSVIVSNISSVSFFFSPSCLPHYTYVTPFVVVPHFLNMLPCFFPVFLSSLLFNFRVPIAISSAQGFFP